MTSLLPRTFRRKSLIITKIKKRRFQAAHVAGILSKLIVNEPRELPLFSTFAASGRLGAGECSAIVVAIHRAYDLAINDAVARREALAAHPALKVLGTADRIVFAT